MNKPSFNLKALRIASPCSADWHRMDGDDRARHCRQCDRRVYNFANMSEAQIHHLLTKNKVKVCATLYRRADGTIITDDCPVGLRAFRKKVSRLVNAAFYTALSVFSAGVAQARQDNQEQRASGGSYKITRQSDLTRVGKRAKLWGTIYDRNGAVIVNAVVTFVRAGERKKIEVEPDEQGRYEFVAPASGMYTMTIESPGFRKFEKASLRLSDMEQVNLDATLEVGEVGEVILLEQNRTIEAPDDRPGTKLP